MERIAYAENSFKCAICVMCDRNAKIFPDWNVWMAEIATYMYTHTVESIDTKILSINTLHCHWRNACVRLIETWPHTNSYLGQAYLYLSIWFDLGICLCKHHSRCVSRYITDTTCVLVFYYPPRTNKLAIATMFDARWGKSMRTQAARVPRIWSD